MHLNLLTESMNIKTTIKNPERKPQAIISLINTQKTTNYLLVVTNTVKKKLTNVDLQQTLNRTLHGHYARFRIFAW